MREILFRGKDVKGNWHIGLLAHIGNAWYISNKSGVATAFEVIPETVGQYTGLTDKNGKKIFEGDIVHSILFDKVGVVKWYEEYSAFMIYCFDENRVYFLYDNDFSKLEIIGNIHDNPELLKKKRGQRKCLNT